MIEYGIFDLILKWIFEFKNPLVAFLSVQNINLTSIL